MSNIELVINPKEKDLGDNFVVRRSLPDSRKKMVGPFIFWDHMGPVTIEGPREMKVRAHPHIGLATITWLFSGEIMHRDSLGNEQAIRPGEVNWMTAGNGIVHSERSYSQESPVSLEGIQLWLALPKEHEDVDASFFHCKENDIPSLNVNGVDLKLVAGEAFDKKSPVPVYSKLFYLNGSGTSGKRFSLNLEEDQEGAVYLFDGVLEVEDTTYKPYGLIIFKRGSEISFDIKDDARFMVFGGDVFPEKRYIWWNFVSTSKDKIENAKDRWIKQDFGKVINEEEIIPLPND